jgi:hypothetical protein
VTQVPRAVRQFLGAEPKPVVNPRSADLPTELSFSPDLWWLYLWYLGKLNRLAVIAIAAALSGAAGYTFRRALQMTADATATVQPDPSR